MSSFGSRHNFRATVPRIPVADFTRTLEFYVGKLGFKPLYRFDTDAGVGLGDLILRFCDGEPITSEDFSIYVEITRTDELFEKYDAEDVDILFPPRNQPWGSRDFGICDPNGYRLIFGDFRDNSGRKTPTHEIAAAVDAVRDGNLLRLQHLLEADPELANAGVPAIDREASLLHVLIDYPEARHPDNLVDIARCLIEAGADVDSLDRDTEGSTPLQRLMTIDHPTPHEVELTDLLLKAGASVTAVSTDNGMDTFTLALMGGRTACAALMSEQGYPPNFPWVGAGLGRMDLVRSFFGEDDGTAELPADQRADDLGDEAQNRINCAFLVAAINGQVEVIEYLLDRGMDVNIQPPGSDFGGIGGTALHWAARHGHREAVELLIHRGANVRARDDVFQLTPALWAAWYEHDNIKRRLLAKEQDAAS